MENEILCGSACVKHILEKRNLKSNNLNLQMNWIAELAIELYENNINNIKLKCYNSNLYNDFINNKIIDITFDGFCFLNDVIKKGISIFEKELNLYQIKKEIKENEYIILCVQSSIFNNNMKMEGGHFIIVNGFTNNNEVKIINPIKEKYEIKSIDIKQLIKCCENYGSWRILIKGELE